MDAPKRPPPVKQTIHTKREPEGMIYLNDPACLRHNTGANHPESPRRLTAIADAINRSPLRPQLTEITAPAASREQIARVHHERYIETVRHDTESGRSTLSTGDTAIGPESWEIALKAAGGVIAATDLIFQPTPDQRPAPRAAFCAVRPPGHHAGAGKGMGFCIFNNAAVAARHAQYRHNAEKILIIDWDVHHGNGTQDIFYKDNSVLFMSIHQSPWYPGTGSRSEEGEAKGRGYTINRPLPPGAGDDDIIRIFLNDFLPAAHNFKPDFTIISAGFDSRAGDPLGYLRFSDNGFAELTRISLEMAHIAGNGRLLSILEGGYDLDGTASAALAHIREILRS